MAAPLISVIAPAHNAAPFFEAWMASLTAQSYTPLEVVLVDDGSTDDIAKRAERAPDWLRYLRQEQQGPAAARNAGIRASTGEMIAFLDLDDLWSPGHLHRAVAAFEQQPSAGIAQGLIRNVLTGDDGQLYYCSRAYRFLNLGAAVFRRQVFDRCGLFNRSLRFAEDFDFITRCWEQSVRKINLEEVSLLYHRHDNNMTTGKSNVELGAIRVYKLHLDRVRSGLAPENAGERLQVGFPQYIGQTIKPHDEGLREPRGAGYRVISIIMPAYNGARFLAESVASIEQQNRDDLEVLLVDDGSTDDLPSRAAALPSAFRYLRQENRGPAAARNRGLRESKGELIAFLDIDDRWTPGHLNRLEATLQPDPGAGIAQGRMQQFVIGEDGVERRSGIYRMPYLGSCLFRRDVLDRCGGFDESMRFGEDYDLMFRCWERDVVKLHVPEVSLLYRRHAGNMTRDHHTATHTIVIKRRLERIRTGEADPAARPRAVFQDYIGETKEASQWTRWSA